MKPALVLGLALAANAMTVDSGDNNELFVAPTGKLSDHIQRFPGKIIMYDEVADDELAIKYVTLPHIPAPEYVAYDEVADDELAIKYVTAPEYVAYDDDELAYSPPVLLDDELAYVPPVLADDELAITYQQYQTIQNLGSIHTRFDEVADDELGIKYVHLPVADTQAFDDDELAVKYVHLPNPEVVAYDDDEFLAKKPREENPRDERKVYEDYMRAMRHYSRPRHVGEADEKAQRIQRFDEVADDELAYSPPVFTKFDEVADDELAYSPPVFAKFDEAADDELAITFQQYQTIQNLGSLNTRFDEVADDELAIIQQIAQLPEFVAYDDDELAYAPPVLLDDEFAYAAPVLLDDEFAYAAPVLLDDEFAISQQVVQLPAEHVAFDDELAYSPPVLLDDELAYVAPVLLDDELIYLGQLIRDGGYIPRPYFDDELRAEKPSHMKAQEKTQMKTEKPKRKLRPIVDEAPLAQN